MTTVSSPSTSPGVAAAALRHVTSINDLTNDEIEHIFVAADAWLATLGDPLVRHRIARSTDSAQGRILATLFHEPSTRTRLSFESAMIRLGGQIVTSADPATSSAAKGESLADTVRVVSNYADAIVLRHPRDGAARLAAEYASVPIINGGDGAHEHPTQTLCDLFTLRRENKRLRNLNVVVSGDLRGSRTIHSFVYALARFGANIMLMPAKGMELPAHVDERLREEFNCRPVPRQMYEEDNAAINALYVTPDMPHQLSLIPSVEMDAPVDHKIRKKIDVMYVTRFQKERWAEASGDYPRIDSNFLRESKYSDTAVLHPLPRVGELDVALDGDSRALYFHQASYGVPIRMALIGMLLETEGRPGLERYSGGFPPAPRALYDRPSTAGLRCVNPNCIVHDPLERDYTRSKFWLMDGGPEGAQRLRCVYCETNAEARAVGNAKKREFALIADAPLPDRHHSLPEHLVFFRDAEDARAHGYAERAGHGKRA
jgi:aspartate carbamoyltransferase catalytic subunit